VLTKKPGWTRVPSAGTRRGYAFRASHAGFETRAQDDSKAGMVVVALFDWSTRRVSPIATVEKSIGGSGNTPHDLSRSCRLRAGSSTRKGTAASATCGWSRTSAGDGMYFESFTSAVWPRSLRTRDGGEAAAVDPRRDGNEIRMCGTALRFLETPATHPSRSRCSCSTWRSLPGPRRSRRHALPSLEQLVVSVAGECLRVAS
jgi:hypothetical protein